MKKYLDDNPYRWKNWLVACIVLSIIGWSTSVYQHQILVHRPIFLAVSIILLLIGGLLMWMKDRVQTQFHFLVFDSAIALTILGSFLLSRIIFL